MQSSRRAFRHIVSILAFLVVSWVSPTVAHNLPISDMTLVADDDTLHLELVLNASELSFFAEIDRNHNGQADASEVEDQGEEMARRILHCLRLRIGGRPVAAEVFGMVPPFDSHHLTLRAHYAADAREVPLSVESHLATVTHGSHVTQVTFETPSGRQVARLDAHASTVLLGASEEKKRPGPQVPEVSATRPWLFRFAVAVGLAALVGGFLLIRNKVRKGSS